MNCVNTFKIKLAKCCRQLLKTCDLISVSYNKGSAVTHNIPKIPTGYSVVYDQ